MAKNETRRLKPDVLEADEIAAAAIQQIADYQPTKPALARDHVAACLEAYRAAMQAERDIEGQLATARDNSVAAGWELHDLVLDIKAFVAYQYGPSSNELQLLGVKKKSERKTPVRRKAKEAA
jgi:hypothetical protein